MNRTADRQALDWLGREIECTGYDPGSWFDASVWLLHAMYESADLPAGITHDDVDRIERAAGVGEPTGNPAIDDIISRGTLTGSPLGRSRRPGPGWKRLTWRELGRRLEIDPIARSPRPSQASFPYMSWPINVAPPAEGSLDREQFVRLLDHLAWISPAGDATDCVVFYATLAVGEFDEPVIYRGPLSELVDLYDDPDLPGSPSNIWPDGRTWFVYTDWDLWATKVSGCEDLINALVADRELETVASHGVTIAP